MIRLQRSMNVRRGQHALTWAKELFAYMKATHGKPTLHLFRSRFGNVSTLYWTVDFKDMDALLTWQKAIAADAGYHELIQRSLDIIIEGTIEDTILETV